MSTIVTFSSCLWSAEHTIWGFPELNNVLNYWLKTCLSNPKLEVYLKFLNRWSFYPDCASVFCHKSKNESGAFFECSSQFSSKRNHTGIRLLPFSYLTMKETRIILTDVRCICLSVRPFVRAPVRRSVRASVRHCLFACMSVRPSMFVYLPIYVSV